MAARDLRSDLDFGVLDRRVRATARLAVESDEPGSAERASAERASDGPGPATEYEPRLEPRREGGPGKTLSSPLKRKHAVPRLNSAMELSDDVLLMDQYWTRLPVLFA